MKLFIDCEWNGHRGQLISMALVDLNGNYFYGVLDCPEPVEWIRDNVMPVLGQPPISKEEFSDQLREFLNGYSENTLEVIADWPEDIKHFCDAICAYDRTNIGPGFFTTLIDHDLFNASSKAPHNALADAQAIRHYYLQRDAIKQKLERTKLINEIGQLMSDITEDCFCASWLPKDTEYTVPMLCLRAVKTRQPQKWGRWHITLKDAETLVRLSEELGSWANQDDEYVNGLPSYIAFKPAY